MELMNRWLFNLELESILELRRKWRPLNDQHDILAFLSQASFYAFSSTMYPDVITATRAGGLWLVH